ncbi:GntR family transcriptional regulator [Cytobacillus firmus]|uniref:GntR family transcriptional regulator n=1 Tax=Cytobacillus firmus TaxID=1399 RepID=UPI00203C48D6|nr:GntR family transcriptional regulator [Cytobacillus firmus]MCM3704719.1 GntR family transcriptional regulator [Cytobacillus firmus]
MNKNSVSVRISAKDFAYQEIKERILKCEYTPNQPIAEEELAKDLKISRTPLREAMQRLELEELVVRQTNGRLKVAPVSVKEVRELFLVRSMLEGIIAAEAAEKCTEQDVRHLSYFANMIKQTANERDMEAVSTFGSQFHTYLYEVSQNKTAVKILRQLNDHIMRYRRLAHFIDTKETSFEHEALLEVIAKKDKHNAELMMKKHVLKAMEKAVTALKQYENTMNENE